MKKNLKKLAKFKLRSEVQSALEEVLSGVLVYQVLEVVLLVRLVGLGVVAKN